MAEKCTNTSSPVDRWMKPYPLAPLNHLTVPFSLTTALLSPLYIGKSPRACFLRRAGAQPKPAGTNDGGVPEWEQAGSPPGSAAGSRVSPGNAAERQGAPGVCCQRSARRKTRSPNPDAAIPTTQAEHQPSTGLAAGAACSSASRSA